MPRLGLAARPDPAPPGDRGALRVRLPDPARRGREAARRPRGRRSRLHRSACVGRGLPSRRGLGRARSDVRSARGRGTPAARVHRGAGQRRARDRRHGSLRGHVRLLDVGDAGPRGSSRDAPLHRRAVGGNRRAGRGGRRRARAAGRPAHAGRRTDVRVGRRHGRPRVEHHGAFAGQAQAGRGACAPADAQARPGRVPARRAGQVVSGGAAAALGDRHLVARRRRAAVARSGAHRGHVDDGHRHVRRRASARDGRRLEAGAARERADRRLRGRAQAPRERVGAAGQRRSVRRGSGRARGACPPRPAPAGRARLAGGLRAAAPLGPGIGRHRLGDESVAAAPRAPLPAAGRFAARASPSARVAAGGAARGRGSRASGRSVRAAGRAARTPQRAARARAREQASGGHPDRALHRGARRSPARLPAAGRAARGLGRADRRDRGGRGRCRGGRRDRRVSAAARPSCVDARGDARSGRHRGQRPPGVIVARARRRDDGPLRGCARLPAGRRESSCSTVATPAPAAAIT